MIQMLSFVSNNNITQIQVKCKYKMNTKNIKINTRGGKMNNVIITLRTTEEIKKQEKKD